MIRKLKRLVTLLVFGVLSISVHAQKTMDVSGFTRDDADMMARITKPVRDKDEGKLCALIRVETGLKDLEVHADALGIVEREEHTGEVWLYVPYGAKSLSFYHEGYFSLLYQYEIPIEEGVVYKLRLVSYDTPPSPGIMTQTQMFVLTHNPDEATVIIDDMEVPTENGVFAAMMNKGEHSYVVKAPKYNEVEGYFLLEDQPVRKNVKLEPLFATFKLRTLPEDDFNVFINGNLVGTSPYNSDRLEPNDYLIHIEKKDFIEVDTLIRLNYGDNLELALKSEEFYPHNNLLGGRDVSFGLHAAYRQPFASSSASGGFCGSPINYSLGNSLENVEYNSQSGFNAGVAIDIRLYKNLYILTGIDYAQVKYNNKFNEPINHVIIRTINNRVYLGNMKNSYKEDYTMHSVELPILASYRFVFSKISSLHLNLGPYLSYGLSSSLKFSGSSECEGYIYPKIGSEIDYSEVLGTFINTYHVSGDLDMYSKDFSITKTTENTNDIGLEDTSDFHFKKSPISKLNYGIKAGVSYEVRGFQLGLVYTFQLSNMANSSFWESSRIPIFNNFVGENNMSGYKYRIHSLDVKLGYVFRYKAKNKKRN